jgi:small-conductance mechanosensitive channel
MFSAILRVLVWLVAGFSIIRLIFPKLDLTPILASASVLGVAIGFGAQTVIKDFLSGLFIILENQYRVGDVVEIDGAIGTVEQISLRSTIVRDNDGSVHYIPNGSIAHAINKTMGFAKINLAIEVASSTDVDALAKAINEVGDKLAKEEKWKARIMDPPHFLGIDAFNTSTLEVKIVGKTQPSSQWSVTGELRKRLVAAFKKEGIIATKIPGEDTGTKTKKK